MHTAFTSRVLGTRCATTKNKDYQFTIDDGQGKMMQFYRLSLNQVHFEHFTRGIDHFIEFT